MKILFLKNMHSQKFKLDLVLDAVSLIRKGKLMVIGMCKEVTLILLIWAPISFQC